MSSDQPNVILINCDDLGYGDLGCYGSEVHDTPAIDRMASEGIRLTDFYMASPVCSPSRGAMLTGCYPRRIGFAAESDRAPTSVQDYLDIAASCAWWWASLELYKPHRLLSWLLSGLVEPVAERANIQLIPARKRFLRLLGGATLGKNDPPLLGKTDPPVTPLRDAPE